MSSDLVRRGGGGSLNRPSRAHLARQREIVERAQQTALEIDGLTALHARGMDRVRDLDDHRKATASNDETLNCMLTRLELGFVSAVESKLRRYANDFGV